MWSNHKNNIPARGFSTPPASWKSPHCPAVMPMSERKSVSSGCKRDLFHVIHKVPAGDSPYVRAKHVQLIEKDPSRAVSLFWAAINSGDRIDSALKDMAVRSGRIDEEIEMLQRKLKNIEEGIAFGGKRTKTARSQGKKIQITVEQERSRILGNLAWACLQHHDYGLAEQHYRKALSLEPDKNKQCNLAICLMHMNRIPEAKSLIQAISDSCGSKQMDDSYAKSFERAVEMLTELESKSMLKPTEEDKENQRSLTSPITRKLKEVTSSTEGGRGYVSGFMDSRRWTDGQIIEPLPSDNHNRGSYFGIHPENQGNFFEFNNRSSKFLSSGLTGSSVSSQQNGVDSEWRKGHYFESPGERSTFSNKMKENSIGSSGKGLGSANKKMLDSPAAVLYTQPKRVSGRFGEGDQRRVGWEEYTVEKPSENLLACSCTVQNLDGELDSTDENSEVELSKSMTEVAHGKITGVTVLHQFSQPRIRTFSGYDDTHVKDKNVIKSDSQQASWRRNAMESGSQMGSTDEESDISPKFHLEQTILVDDARRQSETSIDGKWSQSFGMNDSGKVSLGKNSSTKSANKSWADMVEEEEEKLLTGKDLSPYFDDDWNYEEESNDENQDSNIVHQTTCPKSPVEAINQKLEAFDLKDGYDTFSNAVSPRNPTVRRSLCFDGKNGFNMRKKHRAETIFSLSTLGQRFEPDTSMSKGLLSHCTQRINFEQSKGAMKSYQLSELTRTEVESLKARLELISLQFSQGKPSFHLLKGRLFFLSYTTRFGKVKLERIVENVSELPDLEGVRCKRVARSISSVGLYVPGEPQFCLQRALMLSVEVLYSAKKAGVTHVLKAGGVQAISAMAWGTESCPKVEKIFGPGNQYVTAAKMILQNSEAMISIDMPAGPSEVLVIAERHASPVHIVADLLSQAEHGPDSQVVPVICWEWRGSESY
ncbi:hypothetical protein GH714_016936 [Hevea brasiliensis]|uniref:Uncharacterized protein n=1 Tax=Hevea brasiliensis TaxID=3981 RepID=A0A6A6MFI9_HEVBR|nr:hypothetical protein GH714_016936 [Hevea brasiliensis]